MDTGADLNVYLTTGDDGEAKGSCCAPPVSPAAAPPAASAGCCGPAKTNTALPSGLPAPSSLLSGETDLNEFVGKSVRNLLMRDTRLIPYQAHTRSLLSRNELALEVRGFSSRQKFSWVQVYLAISCVASFSQLLAGTSLG